MSSYTTRPGDTFAIVSRVRYGVPDFAGDIAQANPGVDEPLQPGTVVIVPEGLDGAPDVPRATVRDFERDAVALEINGQRFRFWESVSITRHIDAPRTLTFTAPFEVDRQSFRRTFRPFSYQPLTLTIGGEPVFNGTLVGVDPEISAERKAVNVSAYSRPAVLQDCTPPFGADLEFDGFDLRDLARTLARPFGVPVIFQGDPGAAFEREAIGPGVRVAAFLTGLAQQRGFIISDTVRGELLIWKARSGGAPVARLKQGASPLLSVTPQFDPQGYYSHITGMEQTAMGTPGGSFTARNTHLPGVLRPFTFAVTDAVSADVEAATRAKLGRMFGSAASYRVEVSTWRDPSGRLWRPNTTVTLEAPDAMVYREYEMLIREVVYDHDGERQTAQLSLVLPGTFTGEIPEALPWDG